MREAQLKRLHVLLGQTKLMDQKPSLVSSFSNGRTESSRELTDVEAEDLINWLDAQQRINDPGDRQRKLIIHYAHQMGYEREPGKIDMDRVNAWCIKFGQYHKPLNDHTLKELPYLVTQFEQVYKSFLKGI